ncbi:MAG: nucleotide sugar dehydrogenase [Alphaproteobacteria bacterium]|nr:nucleotide sugar dehydrogenase [Alphaproteobacteria bacterium]MBV8548414.1 nucleotide sugar dehydrogenase [Alphaproteobacteria bacterium]
MSEKIAVIGLGYVGLPLLVGLSRHFDSAIGFDIDPRRVKALQEGHDWTGEVDDATLKQVRPRCTDKVADMAGCSFFIVTVPTPIDDAKRPDLTPVLGACRSVGEALKLARRAAGDPVPVVVFESTVYPGLTEELCGAKLEEHSGLKRGQDFRLGYSPERINPGDQVNKLETIIKVISAEDDASLDRLAQVYGKVVPAGLYRAANIRVAEAAKVLENTQRDLNIALMNELALICDRMDIRTRDVLDAAATKWNFLKFTPGLVGGHCIGVDPYYLTSRAEELGYNPQVILAGRRINDHMGVFVAQKTIKLVNGDAQRVGRGPARIGVLGLSFKENVRDIRNSRVPDIIAELKSFGAEVILHDPVVDPAHAQHEYGLATQDATALRDLDALILASPHKVLLDNIKALCGGVRNGGWVVDVKSALNASQVPAQLRYWSL